MSDDPTKTTNPEVCTADLPLGREVFLRSLVRELSGVLEDVVGLEAAKGYISIVGQRIGEQINAEYRNALGVDVLSREQVEEVLGDLKLRIQGDIYVRASDQNKVVYGNRGCPFGEAVEGRESLCMMTCNVFGTIGADNTGYSKVRLDRTMARGDSECQVTVFLGPSEESDEAEGQEYYAGE